MIKRVLLTGIMIVAAISMMAQSLDWNSVVYQANNGDEKSMYIYSYYSIYGEEYGIKKDYKGAVTMLQKLVAKTPVTDYIIMGYVLLGDCYEKGYGVIKDIDTAREWWTLATNYNNVNAQVKIAEFYNKDENEAISEFAAPPAPPKEEEKPKEEPKPELKPEPKPAPELIFTAVEQKAIYPGGDAALLQWVTENLHYPTKLRQEGIEGRVYVKFVVEKDGSIGDVEIARGKHVSLDAEAMRVVKKIPKKFTPAKQNGQSVRSWFTLPVTFKLPSNDNLTITVKGVSFKMKKVEGGTFQMGSNDSEADGDEKPVHNVTLSDYYIGETEVTQELWEAVMGSNPSGFKDSKNPVERVSWNDCQEFIKKLNQLTGKNFRLPTEAEWEYAARGGNKSRGYKYSGSNRIDDVAWCWDNASSRTHRVGTKLPNELGIYDMTGNVCEWCADWYGDYSSSSQTNPTGSSLGYNYVNRGGSWNRNAYYCRVSNRYGDALSTRSGSLGFRLVISKSAPGQIYTVVEQKAVYSGGAAALLQWISANISYPTKPKQEGIEGQVYVKFVVEKDGSIGDVEIARGKHVSLDAEAVRVVKKIPKKFTPAKQNGQVVRSWFTLPITFKLPSNDNLTITVKGVSFNMIKVEGGTFQMGAQNNNPNGENYVREAWGNETPVHNVTLSDYYIGETEVTQELWGAVMGSNPSNFNGLNNPVEYVSWNDCQEFIKKLNQLTGKNFRLPTEAEWEYAARGGNKGRGYKYSGSNTIDDVAWYDVNAYNVGSSSSSYGTHPVGVKLPNELGLYDMSGNVWEWCSDWYSDWYGKNYYSSSPQTNPSGPTAGTYRVLRGGGWNGYADNCRVSHRTGVKPAYRFVKLGLRLVCSGL